MTRFDRNIRLFGAEGQQSIRNAKVAIVGVGGLGSHIAQQLALLGVGSIVLIDDEEISISNKNRYIGVYENDPVPGSRKVDLGARLIQNIDSSIRVARVPFNLLSSAAFE